MAIELGACVLVAMEAKAPISDMRIEGVVREVVPIEALPRTAHFSPARPARAAYPRFVVQCAAGNVLRSAVELVVIWP